MPTLGPVRDLRGAQMSIFPSRRSDDDDLAARLSELESAHQELARRHVEACARYEEEIEIVWLAAIPAWLRDMIERAKASGWSVARLRPV